MSIVKAGALARWAAKLPPGMLVAIGDEWDWEDDDSDVTTIPMKRAAHRCYLYEYADPHGTGFILTERTFLTDCECHEEGQHLWKGKPIWRLGN